MVAMGVVLATETKGTPIMPQTHALRSHAVGGPDSLQLDTIPIPTAGPDEILIRVMAAGVNYPDTLIIRDLYQFKPPRPFAPGGEVAGVVEAIGERVTTCKPGDRVIALTGHGGFATHITVNHMMAQKIPDAMPYTDAAAFMMTYATSHYALKMRAQLQAGETLFILGAAGGVGSAAIELGKAMGARVIAGISSAEKESFCKELGADETYVYPRSLDKDQQKLLSNTLKGYTGGAGVNVVYDAVGGDYAEPSVRALAWEGRYLVVGFPAGIPSLPLNLTLLKSCQIMGVFWGAFTMRDPQGHTDNMNELFTLYTDGKIKPQITHSFPLEQASQALYLLEDRKAKGKIIITMDG